MKTKTAIFGAMALLSAGLALAAEPVRLSDETDEAKTARMAWWMHDRFGMFIHFGLYSLPGRHEWVKSLEQMDNAAYEKYFRLFDPDRLDVREWVRQAKRSGMKYVVLTTKHHEGFCLFDSKLTDYKITKTKYGKDLVREYVEACRAEGLKVGFYYSLPDWHHAEFPIDHYHPQRPVTWGPWDKRSQDVPQTEWDKVNVGRDMAKYREYLYGQVTELLTNYGKVDLLWFDFTRPEAEKFTKHAEDWEAEKLLALVRRLQPWIVVNDRLGLGETTVDGWDFVTPEQIVPNHWEMRHGKRVPWETCQTFSGSWGYHRDESTWKSPKDCIALLVRTVSFGGNLIMNVGPTARGDFDGRACDRLDAYASWMTDHAHAIYGCTAAPAEFSAPAGTFLTYNPGTRRLYLHLVDYPSEPLGLGFADRVEYAQFLNDFSELSFDAEGRLRLPKAAPPVLVPVVEFFLKSGPGAAQPTDIEWFANAASDALRHAERRMADGTVVYAPQGTAKYKAFWLRDYEMMLEAGIVPTNRIVPCAKIFLNALSPKGEGVDCVKFDGTPIYKPGYGKMGENAVLDGGPYTVLVAYHTWRRSADGWFLSGEVLGRLAKALAAIPHDRENGLPWIDPSKTWDRCPWGFTDTVRKAGCCLFSSLLEIAARRGYAEMLVASGDIRRAEAERAEAARLVAAVNRVFWDEDAGLYRAATVRCREHDVMGSAYAVWLGVSGERRTRRIAGVFRDRLDDFVSEGQVRHLPKDVYWECDGGIRRDTYQNGAYWGTASGWYAWALAHVDRSRAIRLLGELRTAYERYGAVEWSFGKTRECPEYLSSLALPLQALRRFENVTSGEAMIVRGESAAPVSVATNAVVR